MSQKKQLVINFIAQVLFSVINLGISFFLVPHIIESLNATAYGFINLSNDFVNYASLITVALNSIAGRYITIAIHKKQKEEANIYYNSVIIANIIMSVIIFIPLMIFTLFIDKFLEVPVNILSDVKILFTIVFVNFVLSLITSVFTVATFTTNKLYLNSIASIASQVSRCIILLLLYSCFKSNVWYVGFASLISTIIVSGANYVFTKKLMPELYFDYKLFNINYVWELLKNGVWNSVNKLSGILQTGLDLLLSNIFVGAAAMGIISLPRTINSIIFSLFGSIASIFNPNIMQAYAKDDYDSIKRQLNFSMKFVALFSNICIAVFIVLGINFYNLWVPTQNIKFLYFLSIIAMPTLSIGLPLEPVYCVHTSANKIKQPALVTLLLSCITITLVFIGVNVFTDENIKIIIISGTSTILSLLRLCFYIPVYTAKILNEKKTYLYPIMFRNLFSLIICIIIGFLIKPLLFYNNWIMFFISCAILSIIYLLINFIINFNKNEKTQFIDFFKKQFKIKRV